MIILYYNLWPTANTHISLLIKPWIAHHLCNKASSCLQKRTWTKINNKSDLHRSQNVNPHQPQPNAPSEDLEKIKT